MRANTVVGVPLTLLQLFAAHHTGAPPDAALIAHNFAIASAIYGADRAGGPLWAPERRVSQISALGVAAWYAQDPQMAPLAPVVLGLHLGYTPAKPLLAPVKPFFVAWWWAVCVYALPALHTHVENKASVVSVASFYLSLAALSHAVDVLDVEEDADAGVITPAVALGDEARGFAVALALSAWVLDQASPAPCVPYHIATVGAAYGLAFNQSSVASGCVAASLVLYAAAHDIVIVDAFLASSQIVHEASVNLLSESMTLAKTLDEPYKTALIDAVFSLARQGDAFGHELLVQYERLARLRL